jgi:hypothetical protein
MYVCMYVCIATSSDSSVDKQCDVLWWCGEDQRQAIHKVVVVWWKKMSATA